MQNGLLKQNFQKMSKTEKLNIKIKFYFQTKTGKVNSTIELCISESVQAPNSSLNWEV